MNRISKKSLIARDVKLGKNVTIWHFCNLYGCKIGNNVSIGSYTEIRTGVAIGDGTRIQANVFIPEGVTIGKNVFIGPNVVFTNDKYPSIKSEFTPQKIYVEDDAVIGAGSIILPNIRIGKGAFIGAGSLVVKDVKSGTLVYGSPARRRKRKFK